MVEILVKNTFLAAKVVFYGDAEGLDEIDGGFLLDEDPRLPLFFADRLSGNFWHDVYDVRVSRVDVTVSRLRFMGAYLAHGTTRCD